MSFRTSTLKSIYLIFYFVIFITPVLCAQQLGFFKYGVEKGLSQETINTILKDSNGFLWLGTQDGLNRFDGHAFKVYKSDKSKAGQISGNFINALVEDQLGNIWIGTKNNGLCYYEPNTDTFTKLSIENLPNNAQCNKLSMDENGVIYATFLNQGLAKITVSKNDISVSKVLFFETTAANITALKVVKNSLWIGTRDGEVYYANILKPNLEFKKINSEFNNHKIHTFESSANGLWIGTDTGLFHWNQTLNLLDAITFENQNSFALFDLVAKNNEIYLATDSGFIWCNGFDNTKKQFSQIRIYDTNSSEETGLLTNRINCVFVENDFLWLGADKLYQATLKDPVFKLVKKNKPRKSTLINEHIYTFAKSKHGLWVGTLGGLHLITKNKTYHYNNIPHNTVRSIAIDYKNQLWVGTQKGVSVLNLNQVDLEDPNFITVDKHPVDSLSLSNLKIRNIHTTKDGGVWIATLGGGTHRFIGDVATKDFRFQQFKNRPNSNNSISTNVNYVIFKDQSQNYWIGTEDGLNRLKFKDSNFNQPVFSCFRNEEGNLNSISNNTILSIFEDAEGILWVGTLNGLNKFNSETNSFKNFNVDNGLTNGVVYAIQQDESGLLWLSTNAGVFSFNTKTERFTNYNKNDGLQGNEFNLGASFKDKNNTLFFGGTNGYNYFNPNDINKLNSKGTLTFTNVKIKDDNYYFKALINASENSKITLAHNQFPLYLGFSDLDFNPQKNNNYVYKLLPNDTEWNNLQSRKEIQFLNMASGDYTLLVQGITRGKIWESKPLELNFEVTPPWWKTRLAFLIYTLSLFLFIYALYYFQLQKKLQEQQTQKLKELDALKTKLYTNITHEFRTPLTVIKGVASNLSDHLKKQKDETSVKSLKTIEQNSNTVLKLVNQMLDLTKIDKQKLDLKPIQSDLVWYIKHIITHFSSFAETKGIQLTFYSEEKTLLCDFDPDAIQKIMSNLISNAIKNTGTNDQIVVHLKTEKNTIELKVKDSGKGISKEDLASIFDRFYQVENSSEYTEEGSGIGLTLTKELINLMNGTITVESELHVGTTFSMSLPITNNATDEPPNKQLLDDLITSHSYDSTSEVKQPGPVSNEKSIILIVDDNKDILSVLQTSLESHYGIIAASNGKEGIEKAIEFVPDIIISDIMMPETNGFELCRTLKDDERTSHIPIILLTAKATDQDRIKGLSNGADAFITKPFNKAELFVRIQELIKLRTLLYQKYSSASSWDAIPNKDLHDKDAAFMNKVLYHIEQHIDDASFNSMRLSKAMNLSESQLYRKLKATTDASTAVFIRKVRLQKAKTLLQNSENTISEIAYQTGFNSPGWFSRAFKEEFGYSPNDLRNKL